MDVINLRTDDIPSRFENFAYNELGIEVTEEELWAQMRESEDIPHAGNMCLSMLFPKIEKYFEENHKDIEITYFINSLDSHLYANGEEVGGNDTLESILEDIKEQQRRDEKNGLYPEKADIAN